MDPRESVSHGAPPESPHRAFAPAATALYAVLWAILLAPGWIGPQSESALDRLYYPAWSAARVAARDLEVAEAIDATSGLERTLLTRMHGSRDEVLELAIAIHRDLVDELASREGAAPARAQLAVLLAESGAFDDSVEVAREPPWLAQLELALHRAYGAATGATQLDAPDAGDPAAHVDADTDEADLALLLTPDELLDDWLADRLAVRQLRSDGDSAEARAIESALRERGRRRLARELLLLATDVALLALGLAVLLVWAMRRPHARPRGALPPWSLADGLAVLVRGEFFSQLYFAVLPELEWIGLPQPVSDLLYGWGTLLASLPLVWLVWRHLLRPFRPTSPDPLGLDPRLLGAARIAGFAAAAVAIDLLGSSALGWLGWELGFDSHWSEGFDETLVWGSSMQVWLGSVDYIALTPAIEELAFRGVLYFSLRRRLSPLAAAAVSGAIFSLLHFYSVPGFLVTLWSGVVWALVFERSRSLWPGAAAHAIYNLLYVLGLLLLYR